MGLRVTSRTTGFLPQTQTGNDLGQVQGSAMRLNAFLTMRSSSEWKVMTHRRPPGFSRPARSSSAGSSGSSSSLTAMRSA